MYRAVQISLRIQGSASSELLAGRLGRQYFSPCIARLSSSTTRQSLGLLWQTECEARISQQTQGKGLFLTPISNSRNRVRTYRTGTLVQSHILSLSKKNYGFPVGINDVNSHRLRSDVSNVSIPASKPDIDDLSGNNIESRISDAEVLSPSFSTTDPWVLKNILVKTCVGNEAKPEGVLFNIGYIDTGADWSMSRKSSSPTVVAIPGQPGTHLDLIPVVKPLHDDGNRVVVLNMPGYAFSKGATFDDEYCFSNSSSDMAVFVQDFLDTLGIKQVDLVMAHSAGSTPLLIMSATTDRVKTGMVICTPSGHVPSRIMRPLWFIKGIVNIWSVHPGRIFLCWLLPIVNRLLSWLNTDDPSQLMASAKFGARHDTKLMVEIAKKHAIQDFPIVYFASRNDRLVELNLSLEWAQMMGIDKDNFDLYNEDYQHVNDGKGKDGVYKKGVLLTKGGHYPQRKEPALPIIVKEARALLVHANKNNES